MGREDGGRAGERQGGKGGEESRGDGRKEKDRGGEGRGGEGRRQRGQEERGGVLRASHPNDTSIPGEAGVQRSMASPVTVVTGAMV